MPIRPLYPKPVHVLQVLVPAGGPKKFSLLRSTFSSEVDEMLESSLVTSASTDASSVVGCLHAVQSRRTKRWPITAFKAGASKKGFTPMERKRGMVPEAELVWMVLTTKWPVRAAWMAI